MLVPPTSPLSPTDRVSRIVAHYQRKGRQDALRTSLAIIAGDVTEDVNLLMKGLDPSWSDYAVASVYAALMDRQRRKRLGAYFTPPGLVDYLLTRAVTLGIDLTTHRVRDPAAGGAAFIVPIAREMVKRWQAEGIEEAIIVSRLKQQLMGREIDPGLATLANALLTRCLTQEYGFAPSSVASLELISRGDSLAIARDEGADHEIGNPPFLRLAARDEPEDFGRFDDISSGRLNLYAVFVRRGLEALPPNGMLAYIIPASFLGGPEFRKFRGRVRQLGEVLAVDMINGRSTVFPNVVQDTCVLIVRKRSRELHNLEATVASSNYVGGDGCVISAGQIEMPADDGAWILPGAKVDLPSTLSDWGYIPRIGYLVANRQQDRLHERFANGRVPLIWAKAIGQDGSFDFSKGARLRKHGWVDVPADAPYVAHQGCVAIQRTSSRNQKKRITAAEIPAEFVASHGGVVAENHVILLLPCRSDAAAPADLAAALNRDDVSQQMDRMCGSASIPARLLSCLPMPPPPRPKGKS